METRQNTLFSVFLAMAIGALASGTVAARLAYMRFNEFISLISTNEGDLLLGLVMFGLPASFLLSVSVSLFLAAILALKRDR